ncbi:MAG: PAS domain S-box protein [Deltaproteobacteria bacterium]|nr:PAS domain S-box protein [Deltaproteobacteria bacterium]
MDNNLRDQHINEIQNLQQRIDILEDTVARNKQTSLDFMRLKQILDATSDFISTAMLGGQLYYINKGGRALIGLSGDVDICNIKIHDIHPGWAYEYIINTGVPAAIQNGIWTGETALLNLSTEKEIPTTQVIMHHESPDGKFKYLSTIIRDITERKQTEKSLQQSESKYRDLFEKSKDAILIIENQKFVDCNQSTIDMLGYKHKDDLLQTHPAVMSPANQPDGKNSVIKANEMMNIAIKKGGHRFEWDHVRANGEVFPVEVLLTTISNDKDKQVIHTVWRDITDRKMAEKQTKASLAEKEVLLKEVHHRVKNNLSIVSGLMSLQAADMDSPESCEAFAECRDRINAVALVHNTLYRSNTLAKIDYSVYARDLSRAVLDICGRDGQIRLDFAAESVFLEIDIAINCGLILNELLTNAFKHAFPNDNEGSVRVVFAVRDDGHYSLCVSDNGVGLSTDVDFQNPETLGLKLVNMLTRQLKGSLNIDKKNTGTAITITF